MELHSFITLKEAPRPLYLAPQSAEWWVCSSTDIMNKRKFRCSSRHFWSKKSVRACRTKCTCLIFPVGATCLVHLFCFCLIFPVGATCLVHLFCFCLIFPVGATCLVHLFCLCLIFPVGATCLVHLFCLC